MNQVSVIRSSGTSNLTSVEISELTGKRHDHVMVDITKMLNQLGISPTEFSGGYTDQQGKLRPCFSLPPREVKILITGYDVVRRAKVIDRLEQLEAEQKPKDFPAALRAYADEVEKRQIAEKMVAIMEPKARLADAIIADDKLLSLTEAAKHFSYPTKKFFVLLENSEWIYKNIQYDDVKEGPWLPRSKTLEREYLVTKQRPDKYGRLHTQTLVTGKGIAALHKLITPI